MKVINVGLSILISMEFAVSPIHANEIDSTDETNEVETTVDDESNVESQADEKKVTSIYVKSEDENTNYTLDENETKTIKLIVTKCYEDGTEEETTDYQYKTNSTGSNLSVSNSKGKIQDYVLYSGSDNVLSVTKTSRGEAFFNVDISMDGYYVSTSFTFKGTNLVNITLNTGEGHFEDGTTTYTYKGENGYSYYSPVLISPDGYGFKGWFDENGVEINDHKLTSDTTFYARYAKLVSVTFDAGKGHFDNNESIKTTSHFENEYAYYSVPVAPDGLVFCGWYDADGKRLDDIALTEDITVYAKYGHSLKVTLDAKEGSFEDGNNKFETEVAEGNFAPYKTPTPPKGFQFLGWYDKDGVNMNQDRIEKDTIFYAKYAKVFNVTFDAKEGHFEDGSTTLTKEILESSHLYSETPIAPEGMMFVGWYDMNGKSLYECNIDQEMTFYAKYAKAYEVKFDAQEGHFEDGSKKVAITSYEGHSFYPGTIIAPEGKVFDGWYDENGNKIYDGEYKGNVTYYAHYKDAITITLEPNGGTGN